MLYFIGKKENYQNKLVKKAETFPKIKATIVKQWGGLDIVVVNVGSGKSVLDPIPSAENFEHVFSLHFTSPFVSLLCLKCHNK